MHKVRASGSHKALILGIAALIVVILFSSFQAYAFFGFGNATDGNWYNISWKYRVRLEINSTGVNRTNWPVERVMNFTDLLPSGTFDFNSTRVFEYGNTGNLLYEVPSQFDTAENYNAASNALGTLSFIMNGTSHGNRTRIFYIYYDAVDNGPKPNKTYTSNISLNWNGRFVNVSNSVLNISIDTNRGQNMTGITRVVENIFFNTILQASLGNRTAEYIEYANSTRNFTLNSIGNATFIQGPVRTVVTQSGPEVIIGGANTSQGNITKKYVFYSIAGPQAQGGMIKIIVNFTNTAGANITRNSTNAGALAIDADRTLSSGSIDSFDSNTTDPYSYAWASGLGGEIVGLISVNESVPNFFAKYAPELGRIGISLSEINLSSGSSIQHEAVLYFATGGSDAVSEFITVRGGFSAPVTFNQSLPETWTVRPSPLLVPPIYNRNESVLIRANFSQLDPYNLTFFANATLDNGTASAGDDHTVQLFDDGTNGDQALGDRIFSRNYTIASTANVSEWHVNMSAYDQYGNFLNSTIGAFNVTDVLNVTVAVKNPTGLVNRQVIADVIVKNFRADTLIAGATVGCVFSGINVVNQTDMGNGTYAINFTTPAASGTFALFCNATRLGNTGNGTDMFSADMPQTTTNISVAPMVANLSNITFSTGQTFTAGVNVSNTGNGTASNMNITLSLPANWSYSPSVPQCGNISALASCLRLINITVAAGTVPQNYTYAANATWTNPDTSIGSNTTSATVNVLPNPVIDVLQTNITTEAGDGVETVIGNFTVISTGNDYANNITFTCISGTVCVNFSIEFSPFNKSTISAGSNVSVVVNVTVPYTFPPGTYTGIVNISSNSNSDTILINVTVPAKTNLTATFNISSYSTANITTTVNDTFVFSINISNSWNGSARNPNITLVIPGPWSYTPGIQFCSNLTKYESCVRNFTVTISNFTVPGNYTVNSSTNWLNPDGTNGSSLTNLNVAVLSNPLINITPSSISATLLPGFNGSAGNFTVASIGNDAATGITFTCLSGTVCTNFSVIFVPSSISSIAAGSDSNVSANVSIPSNFPFGSYTGSVNVSSATNSKILTLNVDINANRTWTMSPTSCLKSQSPREGTACDITVINLGNAPINFTLSPPTGNQTTLNETAFMVNAGANKTFSVLYNTTNVSEIIYNSTFTATALQNSTPQFMYFNVTLLPFTPPNVTVYFNTTAIQQNSSILILANVTDNSGSGINYVNMNITTPNATFLVNMSLLSTSGNTTVWTFSFPNITANHSTLLRGIYNATVIAEDLVGNRGNTSGLFRVYAMITPSTSTLSSSYLQGDSGSIIHIVRNITGLGLQNVSATFTVRNPGGNITSITSGTTDNDGIVTPFPSFSLQDDALTGNYTLSANSTYFDPLSNITASRISNTTFSVSSKTVTVTGLFADVETAVVWYPNNVMRFSMLIYDASGQPTDPSSANLTVLDPAGNLYFAVTNISQLTKQQTGFYTYQFSMPVTTSTGMYLAIFEARQNSFLTRNMRAFRVASGGPYDVRLTLPNAEVSPGDTLPFIITIENKGEVSQDVFIDYSVTSTSGTVYYTASEAVFTPAVSNQSFNRNAAIFSTQPFGTYILQASVRYDNVQPVIVSNTSFIVVGSTASTPPTGGGGGGPTTTVIPVIQVVTETHDRQPPSGIFIASYNDNISASKGFTRVEKIVVTNTGQTPLRNITLVFLGIPSNWYNVSFSHFGVLESQESAVFIVEFNIPKSAVAGTTDTNVLVTAGTTSDQRAARLNIFESPSDLLKYIIDKAEEDYRNLLVSIRVAEKQGKDVSSLDLLTDQIENNIRTARQKLDEKDYQGVYDDIDTVHNTIEKAYEILESITVVEIGEIPFWLIAVVLIFVVLAVIILIYLQKKKKINLHMPKFAMPKIAMKMKHETGKLNDQLSSERDKVLRMINVLEDEKKEGIMTDHAYTEMKSSLQDKLNKINRKIGK